VLLIKNLNGFSTQFPASSTDWLSGRAAY